MVTAPNSDPFRAIYLDRAVRDIIESLGVRQGKEARVIQLINSYAGRSHARLSLAGIAVTDEKLSRVFIDRHGKEIWSNKELVSIYYRVEWSRFASIADTLFTPPLNRLWPLLHSARAIQFPRRSLLGVIADYQHLSDAGEQHRIQEERLSESGGFTSEDNVTFPSTGSDDSRSTSLELESPATSTNATAPGLSPRGKVQPKPSEDVRPSTATAYTDPPRYNKGLQPLQLLPADLEADLILHKQPVLEKRKLAMSRTKEEEARFERVQERIRLKLEVVGPHPQESRQSLSNRPEKPGTVPSDQPPCLLNNGSDQPTVRFPPTNSWSPHYASEASKRFNMEKMPVPPEVYTLPPNPPPVQEEPIVNIGHLSAWEYHEDSTQEEAGRLRRAMFRSQQCKRMTPGKSRTFRRRTDDQIP